MFQPNWFGKYYLYERIAVGGMAEIFRAKMYGVDGFEKDMVVKQILPQYANNHQFIQMFIDEAKISVNLSHGNIVPIFELGQVDGVYFISMECVDGVTLGELMDASLENEKPISVSHALFIACEILSGLDYAHRKTDPRGQSLHIVHRDISPQNILISFEGEVKIVDFGIARAAMKVHNTEIGVVKGKLGYMSPEQALGKDIDARADIFAAGIVLFEMLTLKKLFDCDGEVSFLESIKRLDIPTPSMINPHLPAELDAIVFKALEPKPEKRFHFADEMGIELSRILYSLPDEVSSKTLSVYVKDLFVEKLKTSRNGPKTPERRREKRLSVGINHDDFGRRAQDLKPTERDDPLNPEDLFHATLRQTDGMQPDSGRSTKISNGSLDDDTDGMEDNFSYLAAGRKLKTTLGLMFFLAILVVVWIFHRQIMGVFQRVDRVMDESAARLAQKKLGSLIINTKPSGAVVYFDGRKVGSTNIRIGNIDPDKEYELVLTLQGYSPWSRRILPTDWKEETQMMIRIFYDWTSKSFD